MSTTVGALGQPARWTVSPWGSITEWGVGPERSVDWFVAADDRWHVPEREPTVRQRRVDGLPVVETRVRVPDGDAVQRVWAVPDRGGLVVIEIENASPMPFAVAFSGPGLVTERPPADVPIQGIDLPDGAFVMPVGHQATVRVVVPAAEASPLATFPALAPVDAVVSGWTSSVDRAGRLSIPDESLGHDVVAARADLLLEGPVASDDPVGFLLDVGELVRCGEPAEAWLPELVEPAERVARELAAAVADLDRSGRTRRRLPWRSRRTAADVTDPADVALDAVLAAARVAAAGDDHRAVDDLARIVADLLPTVPGLDRSPPTALAELRRSASVGRFVRSVERRLVDLRLEPGRSDVVADLLAAGLPTTWLGADFDVHGLPVGPSSAVSYAVRWHGERPAVLWECSGAPIDVRSPVLAPDWSSGEQRGETLWPAREQRSTRTPLLSVTSVDPAGREAAQVSEPRDQPESFS